MLTPMPFSAIAMMAKSSQVVKRMSGRTWACSKRSETCRFSTVLQQQKRQAVQVFNGDRLFFGKGMSHWQHGLVLIPLEQERVELRQRRKTQKAAVHPPLVDPMLDLLVVAEQHFIFDAGVVLLQCGKDVRQPVDAYARKGADADDAGLYPVHPVDLPCQLLMIVQDLAQKRQDLLSGRGQADAALAAL